MCAADWLAGWLVPRRQSPCDQTFMELTLTSLEQTRERGGDLTAVYRVMKGMEGLAREDHPSPGTREVPEDREGRSNGAPAEET